LLPNVFVCEWQFGHRKRRFSLRQSHLLPFLWSI